MTSLSARIEHAIQGLRRARAGSTAVEFALIAPALFTLLFGTIEFGRMVFTQSTLHFAVEEAARCASVTPSACGTSSQIASYAASRASDTDLPASAFTASTPTCGHQVTGSVVYAFIATALFTYSPTLTATACFP